LPAGGGSDLGKVQIERKYRSSFSDSHRKYFIVWHSLHADVTQMNGVMSNRTQMVHDGVADAHVGNKRTRIRTR